MERYDSIKDHMAKDLIFFTPDTDIIGAIETMLNQRISGAPVLDEDGKLVGILSEKDCLKIVMGGVYSNNPSGRGRVADFMSVNVKTIPDRFDVVEAALEFIHSNYRRFPVVNDEGKVVGQISRRDVLNAVKNISPKENVTPLSWKGREPEKYQKSGD